MRHAIDPKIDCVFKALLKGLNPPVTGDQPTP